MNLNSLKKSVNKSIWLTNEVGQEMFFNFHQWSLSCVEGDDVLVLLDSYGGEAKYCTGIISIIQGLQDKGVNLTICAIGHVNSCAVDIFLAIPNRYIFKETDFMVHTERISSAKDITVSDCLEMAKNLKKDNKLCRKYYFKNLKMTKTEKENFDRDDDVYISTSQLKKRGVVKAVLK